jgi:hypothetical protein
MIDPTMRKIEALKKKIMPLIEEMKGYQTQIDALEEGIVKVIGFHVSELVKKVIEPTGATDKNGKPVMVTKYLPTDKVTYDEQKKQYVIASDDAKAKTAMPTTENVAGSDFDKDKEESSFQEPETKPEATVGAEGETVLEVADDPANGQDAEAGDLPWNN